MGGNENHIDGERVGALHDDGAVCSGGITMLVNADHPLPLDWAPDDLVDLWKVQPRHFHLYPRATRLSACAANAANALFEQAEREGLGDFMVLSAFRDSEYQAGLFADSDDGYVARPGQSEHQTGLAFDVAQVGRGLALDEEHAAWLAENCWEHGLVVHYPQNREDVTGIPFEPWHLRYVGREVAIEMRERGWVLEEWHAHVLQTSTRQRASGCGAAGITFASETRCSHAA